MKRYLLDTHTFIWAATADEALSTTAGRVILDRDSELNLSVASMWEMAVKAGLGKLTLRAPLDEILSSQLVALAVRTLAIEPRHALAVQHLPLHHRDPFDRLLVAQCLAEGLSLLSADAALDRYGVERVF